jgi:uncharacterized membrane protein
MSARGPWWQTTRTPRLGFQLGGLFAGLGLLELLLAVVGSAPVLILVIAVLFLVMGTVHLASAMAMRRRQM